MIVNVIRVRVSLECAGPTRRWQHPRSLAISRSRRRCAPTCADDDRRARYRARVRGRSRARVPAPSPPCYPPRQPMSTPSKVDIDDVEFVSFDQLRAHARLSQLPASAELDRDTYSATFREIKRMAEEVLHPVDQQGDRQGCSLDDE